MLFLCPERALHRSRPHSGKLLSDKVFLLFLLTERTASFYERCLYSVRLAVVPVFSSRVASVSFSILPSRSSSLRAIFLVWLLLCLRRFLYVRLAFCTSRNFVRGRWIPSLPLNSLVVDVAVQLFQLFQQFRTAESRVHLQEHQGHFPFRSEERCVPASASCFSLPDRSSLPSRGEEATSLSCPIRSFRKLNSRARKN